MGWRLLVCFVGYGALLLEVLMPVHPAVSGGLVIGLGIWHVVDVLLIDRLKWIVKLPSSNTMDALANMIETELLRRKG